MSEEKKVTFKHVAIITALALLLLGYTMRDDLLMKVRNDSATMSKDPSLSTLKTTKENQ